MPRREDHEVRKGHEGHWIKKNLSLHFPSFFFFFKFMSISLVTFMFLLVEFCFRIDNIRFNSIPNVQSTVLLAKHKT